MNKRSLQLAPNYVWRSYSGGSRLRIFRHDPPGADNHFPEDWLASTSRARNGVHQQKADEGISHLTLDGRDTALTDLIKQNPEWFWGNQTPPVDEDGQIGVLIKLLDSSVRLHLQAHPDREFVKARFGGHAGKTECWYILSAREEDAFVYLGFQHAPTLDEWARMVRDQDLDGMRACFEKIPVKPGDCLMVPSGVPHAIGEGIFMIELQEPTDWVVRCEFSAGGHVLEPAARFMGLELDDVLPMFDCTEYPLATIHETLQQTPEVLRRTDTYTEERIISLKHQEFFRLRRLSGTGAADWAGGEPMIFILLEGEGKLNGEAVAAGETRLLPGAVSEWNWTGFSKRPVVSLPAVSLSKRSNQWNFLLAQPPIR